jgi:hypothetical protein
MTDVNQSKSQPKSQPKPPSGPPPEHADTEHAADDVDEEAVTQRNPRLADVRDDLDDEGEDRDEDSDESDLFEDLDPEV